MKDFLKLALIVICILCSLSATQAQTIVKGTVYDEANLILPSATVFLEGTNIGTITDAKGEYRIPVKPGTHTVIVSFLGYEKSKQEVTIQKGQTKVLDFTGQRSVGSN